ncbi:MAG: hypothetical protein KJ718_02815 [Nanoarchaeota archaeon]|nr:hypothetical protein [Nanoarchaeota archaeon]MBU1051460.1 hypothetical protein [Nanoarchaeota archaeon]
MGGRVQTIQEKLSTEFTNHHFCTTFNIAETASIIKPNYIAVFPKSVSTKIQDPVIIIKAIKTFKKKTTLLAKPNSLLFLMYPLSIIDLGKFRIVLCWAG